MKTRAQTLISSLAFLFFSFAFLSMSATAQWSGWARCVIDIQKHGPSTGWDHTGYVYNCAPAYCEESRGGRPGIDPVEYLKMLMVGFFENLRSERAIAARCEDSLSVKESAPSVRDPHQAADLNRRKTSICGSPHDHLHSVAGDPRVDTDFACHCRDPRGEFAFIGGDDLRAAMRNNPP